MIPQDALDRNGGMMTQESKVELSKIVIFAVIGIVGLTLIVGTLFGGGPRDVEARGGLDAIATPVGCDLVKLNGVQFAVCEDGSQWTLEAVNPLTATLGVNQ
jgi:hypothetical protein